MRIYQRFKKNLKKVLSNYYNGKALNSILFDIHLECDRLAHQVPHIGGIKNPFYANMLFESVLGLALYKTLTKKGMQVEDIGRILLETFTARVYSWPRSLRRIINLLLFSDPVRLILKRRADESRKRLNNSDWVLEYVEGNDEDYEYGVDYLECAICKLYHAHDADEMIKYNCQCDFTLSDALGWGLVRTMTIADGDKKCDFRFKRGNVK